MSPKVTEKIPSFHGIYTSIDFSNMLKTKCKPKEYGISTYCNRIMNGFSTAFLRFLYGYFTARSRK